MFLVIFLLSASNAYNVRQDVTSHKHWHLISEVQEDCGENVADRIIGGINATLGQYPWLARIGFSYEMEEGDEPTVDMYECGGAIINERYVLTAAHCGPDEMGVALVQVRLGEYYTETDPDCVNGVCAPPVQDINVESVQCHKKYNSRSFHNDICLIRLAQPIKFNNFVLPLCLPIYDRFQSDSLENTIMEVAGWGIYDISLGEPNTILQTVKVPMVNHQKCQATYKGKVKLSDKQICAGGEIGKDSCGGDSGGPLMAPFAFDAPPKFFFVGIVSFGPKKCGASTSPGVYTKVADYMIWILDRLAP